MAKMVLTEKEYEVMEILWKNAKPMLASEVTKQVSHASGNSTHHLLNRLMEKGAVKVAGNVKIVKAQSRLYAPAYTTAEFAAIQAAEIFKATTGQFDVKDMLACLVKKNKNRNEEIVQEIRDFIDEYEKGIE